MAKYLVNYYETYSNSYEIEADSKEEAKEKLILEIREGSLNPPEECCNSWCDIKEMEVDVMRTVKEIDKQIQEEHDYMVKLYAQINAYEESMERLKKERKVAEEEELKTYIDNWLNKKFGIENQTEARKKSIFIVFDKEANFVKTITTGYGEEFHYVSPAEDKDTMEYWLKKNKLYAHRASSFCDRNYAWYQKSFKEQLENLCWEFDKNGKLCKTQW